MRHVRDFANPDAPRLHRAEYDCLPGMKKRVVDDWLALLAFCESEGPCAETFLRAVRDFVPGPGFERQNARLLERVHELWTESGYDWRVVFAEVMP
jgi:hypothetical protein